MSDARYQRVHQLHGGGDQERQVIDQGACDGHDGAHGSGDQFRQQVHKGIQHLGKHGNDRIQQQGEQVPDGAQDGACRGGQGADHVLQHRHDVRHDRAKGIHQVLCQVGHVGIRVAQPRRKGTNRRLEQPQ